MCAAPDRVGLLRQHDAELGHQAADAIEGGGALFNESLAHPVHRQGRLRILGFDGNETHVGSGHRFANGGGVIGVVLALLALEAVRRDELGCHQFGRMAQLDELPCPMVGAGAGFHADDAGRQLRQSVEQLIAPHIGLDQHGLAGGIDAMQGKDILGQVDADNRH